MLVIVFLFVTSPLHGEPLPYTQDSVLTTADIYQEEPINIDDSENISWVDNTKNYLSDTVHDFSKSLDQGLAMQDGEEELVNKSYLKLRYRAEYSHHGDFSSDERVSIRIDLPHVKRNWSLIFETDPDDYDSLESKQRGLLSDESKGGSDGAIGGVRLQDGEFYNWRSNLDLGVKLRLPLDPFVRGEVWRVGELSPDWTVKFEQDVFYYHSLGSGFLTEFNLYRAFSEDHAQIFKAGTSAQYLYEYDNWELLFQLNYFDRINDNHLIEYSTGVSIEPNKADEVDNSWISVSWRQKLYKNWLYLYLTPQIDAPRELDYQFNVGVQLEFEVVFSKNRKLDRLNRYIPSSTRVTK